MNGNALKIKSLGMLARPSGAQTRQSDCRRGSHAGTNPGRPVPWRPASTCAFVLLVVLSPRVAAFTQDAELEVQLGRSDPEALARLPSKGYKDGAAGFFAEYGFYVVPGSQRAWCQERGRGILKAGCYVELFFQRSGQNARDPYGDPCGYLGRWYRPRGERGYVPTPGSPFAQ